MLYLDKSGVKEVLSLLQEVVSCAYFLGLISSRYKSCKSAYDSTKIPCSSSGVASSKIPTFHFLPRILIPLELNRPRNSSAFCNTKPSNLIQNNSMPSVCLPYVFLWNIPPNLSFRKALELFFNDILHYGDLQSLLSNNLFVLRKLLLQFLEL